MQMTGPTLDIKVFLWYLWLSVTNKFLQDFLFDYIGQKNILILL